MSICDGCIHNNVCGLEDNHEEGIVSCADMIPKDVLDKIRAEISAMFPPLGVYIYEEGHEVEHAVSEVLSDVLMIIDKYKAESEKT